MKGGLFSFLPTSPTRPARETGAEWILSRDLSRFRTVNVTASKPWQENEPFAVPLICAQVAKTEEEEEVTGGEAVRVLTLGSLGSRRSPVQTADD